MESKGAGLAFKRESAHSIIKAILADHDCWESGVMGKQVERGSKKKRRQTSRRVTARDRQWDEQAARENAILRHMSPVRVVSGLASTPEAFRQSIVDEELVDSQRLSARARRRWTNDRLLRELAGPIKPSEVHTLFSPVPFGEVRTSCLEKLCSEGASERFLALGMDDEITISREGRFGAAPPSTPEEAAWLAAGRSARSALRVACVRASDTLRQLDGAFQEFLSGPEDAECLEFPQRGEPALDSFQRLLVHSLASFYGLSSRSSVGRDGVRSTTVRWRACEAGRNLEPCCTYLEQRFAGVPAA